MYLIVSIFCFTITSFLFYIRKPLIFFIKMYKFICVNPEFASSDYKIFAIASLITLTTGLFFIGNNKYDEFYKCVSNNVNKKIISKKQRNTVYKQKQQKYLKNYGYGGLGSLANIYNIIFMK